MENAVKYKQIVEGELVNPTRRNYKMMCCDCGLVHKLNFFLVKRGKGHVIMFRAYLDHKATAAARRKKRKVRAREA